MFVGHFVHFMPSSVRNAQVYYGRLPLSFKILLQQHFLFFFKVIEVKEKTSGRVKQTVDIPFDFKMNNEPRRGGRGGNRGGRGDRGGRGGRGGRGRGGGGRGGFGSRGDSNESGTNFALNNEEFPTLG